MKKRILSFVLTLCMLLPLFPVMKAEAASYEYKFTVKTANEENASTKSNIKLGMLVNTGAGKSSGKDGWERTCVQCNNSGAFAQGKTDIFYLNGSSYYQNDSDKSTTYVSPNSHAPWTWGTMWLLKDKAGSSQNWKCETITLDFPKLNGNGVACSQTFTFDKWFDNVSGWYSLNNNRRNITDWGDFDGIKLNTGETLLYNPKYHLSATSSSKDESCTVWNRLITDQYGTYNPYDYEGAPTMTVLYSSNTGGTSNIQEYFRSNLKLATSTQDCVMTINGKSIYDAMVKDGSGIVWVTFTVKFSTGVFSTSETKTNTYTFYRDSYDASAEYTITDYFQASNDNHYVNCNHKTVSFTVSPSTLYCKDMDDAQKKAIAGAMVKSSTLKGVVCRGNSTAAADELCSSMTKTLSDDGKSVIFSGTVPDNVTTGSAGISLVIRNAALAYDGTTLYPASGGSDRQFSYSTLKVDTVKPTISLQDKDKKALDISGKLSKGFAIYPVSSEDLYTTNLMLTRSSDTMRKVKMQLLDSTNQNVLKDAKSEYLVGTGHGNNYKIETQNATEGVYKLQFTGYDAAGNALSGGTYTNVLLDTLAPRPKLIQGTPSSDQSGKRTQEFTVTLNDLCVDHGGWARLYYCFVPNTGNAYPTPPTDDASSSQSGGIEEYYNTWCFVGKSSTAEPGTIVLDVAKNHSFTGKLWYFTRDSLGNQSAVQSLSVSLNNTDAKDTLIASEHDTPKSEFDVRFQQTIESQSYTTKYKWVAVDNDATFVSMDLTTYEGGSVGGAEQKGVLLNGRYDLTYTVTPVGTENTETYHAYFTFDNSKPDTRMNWETQRGSFLPIQQVTLKASDISGIANAWYGVSTANGETILTDQALSILENPDGSYVNETVTLSPEKNGVYDIAFGATDQNNTTNTYPSGTDATRFLIRKDAPTILGVNDGITKKVGDVSALNTQDYTLSVTVQEEMLSAAYAGDQIVRYAVSVDGINYTDWVSAGTMTASGNLLEKTFRLENPVTLEEGLNNIFIKVCCSPTDTTSEPSPELVSIPFEVQLLYDTVAPELVNVSYSTTESTEEDVTVTLSVYEVNGYTELVLGEIYQKDNSIITINKESDSLYTLVYHESYSIAVSEWMPELFVLRDEVGNEYGFTINVANIDRDPPMGIAEDRKEASGDRTDWCMDIYLYDQSEIEEVKLALLTEEELYALYGDNVPDEESKLYVPYYMEGEVFTGEQYGRIRDTVGMAVKSLSDIFPDIYELNNGYRLVMRGLDGIWGIGVYARDMLGHDASFVIERAFVDATAAIQSTECYPVQTTTTAVTTLNFNVPLAVLNPAMATGETDEENEEILRNSGIQVYWDPDRESEDYPYQSSYQLISSDNEEHKLYVMDEAGRTSTLVYRCTSEFVTGYNLDLSLTVNGGVVENCSNIYLAENDVALVTLAPHSDYDSQWFLFDPDSLDGLTLNAELSQTADPTAVSEIAKAAAGNGTIYDKLVFAVDKNGKSVKSACIKAFTAGTGISETDWQTYYITAGYYDETPPIVTLTPDKTAPTNGDVTVSAVFSDPESGIRSATRTLNGKTETLTNLSGDQVTLSKNGTVSYTVVNNLDMVTTKTYTVSNIDKTPLEKGIHYSLHIEYKDYKGNWQTAEATGLYGTLQVTAKVMDGTGKQLSVTGQNPKLLTPESPDYSFTFRDAAGNTAVESGFWETFDRTPGTILWELSETGKTNKPVNVLITITDNPEGSGIVYAELLDPNGENIPWNEVAGDQYTATLPVSGIYSVRAWDLAGNAFSERITVSNINTEIPEITGWLYSTAQSEKTLNSVLVTIQGFTKSNVTITSVEPIGNLTAGDLIYAPGSRNIRFLKNGSAVITFADDYGNEGYEIISVSNIYTDPPTLEAVPVPAEDLLSVTVTFRKQTGLDGLPLDQLRTLSELTVYYNGISYAADKAEFKLKTNGEHTFRIYDEAGNIQYITLTVESIDDQAPVIQEVSWTYEYMEENGGSWVKKTESRTLVIGTDTDGKEAGYVIATDRYHVTNASVNVTVTTDKPTAIRGTEAEPQRKNTMVYYDNGAFRFNMKAKNGMTASYIVDVELIDLKAPEIGVKGASELVFIEGASSGTNPDFVYRKSMLLDYYASDTFAGTTVDLTDRVTVDYGGFDPDNINNNKFDRSRPYTVTYTVYDDAGNKSTFRRTIRLVGKTDTFVLINGVMPNSGNQATVEGSEFHADLCNFSGIAYARIAPGIMTMGQMKTAGTVIPLENGGYTVRNLSYGWYTLFIQTDKRDYFTISVAVMDRES